MSTRCAVGSAALVFVIAAGGQATGAPRPIGYGGGCTLHPGNSAATINALRFYCSPAREQAVFRAARRGKVPGGVKNGWVTAPSAGNGSAGPVNWTGKDFHTGPNGGYLLNRTSAGEAWPATVYTAPSRLDGRPCWALNYAPSPTPTVYDEIREVVPGVWLGYTLWPGVYNTPFQLGFVLA